MLYFMAQQSEAIATLQYCLVATSTPKVEVTLLPKFDGQREAVVGFVNACCLYAKARLEETEEKDQLGSIIRAREILQKSDY